ncbi:MULTISPECIES: CrcB family protein [unclassified Rathayibacter]|uniref:fluoride efflux transporter FluC n=1 Tax=unclassified Rathayibacter TaxID=2609250 RepID=UPI000CE720A5|nr:MULTISPECIES: CrcB family protein [unclassified Rathayibacter]PPF50421.1 chromosome condensation protein CrcB [Rathayibacter sp. AY1A1]PPG85936.1 chromosome condensation protein CrcB [Rathayibacter sp. AY1H2]PPG94062.1 chromosome condensation protein CrcB [Rathayibacter sp. AY1G9]PPH03476.1 chromosome condensation protein CrcB [Rathayibacter sp. AY1F6]PPH77347.1 chromosome condensation protein CrcB [Rathayibacter sp. AY1D9]
MTPGLLLAVAVAGGVGAAARLVVDGVARSLVPARWPVGTALINVSGSLLLGVVTGLVLAGVLDPVWRAVLGTGVLGGFTTFSTASVETARLLLDRRWAAGLGYGVGTAALAVAAAAAGLALTGVRLS